MATFVLRDGRMVDKATGEPMVSDDRRHEPPQIPQIMSFGAYNCPITGKRISTLRQHNENLKKHDCVEAKEWGGGLNGEIKNPRFAKKHNLKVSDKYMDTMQDKGTNK